MLLSDLSCVFLFVGVKGMLDKIGTEINGFSKMFPVEASLANFTIFLNQGQKKMESYYPQIDQMDFYRFVHVSLYLSEICHIMETYFPSGVQEFGKQCDKAKHVL